MTAQPRGEETRNRILDAALDSFAHFGYDATSVSQICRRADVTKGGFYHHFPSKGARRCKHTGAKLEGCRDRRLRSPVRPTRGTHNTNLRTWSHSQIIVLVIQGRALDPVRAHSL
jgi:AcrR family transcriptional regulator